VCEREFLTLAKKRRGKRKSKKLLKYKRALNQVRKSLSSSILLLNTRLLRLGIQTGRKRLPSND
jgi:hypothetical protein